MTDAERWTIAVARPAADPLVVALAERGHIVLAMVDPYDLPDDDPAFHAMAEAPGPLLAAVEMRPRALYWLLSARGVKGRRADMPSADGGAGRPIYPLNLAGLGDAAALERILAVIGPGEGPGSVRDLYREVPPRWYPVIDYDRCRVCYDCVEFCLFGVYEIDAGRHAIVALADNCKPGCPACSRVCPAGAIMFPRYAGGGPIAGADEGMPEQLEGQAARQAAARDIKSYRQARPQGEKKDGVEDDVARALRDLDEFQA